MPRASKYPAEFRAHALELWRSSGRSHRAVSYEVGTGVGSPRLTRAHWTPEKRRHGKHHTGPPTAGYPFDAHRFPQSVPHGPEPAEPVPARASDLRYRLPILMQSVDPRGVTGRHKGELAMRPRDAAAVRPRREGGTNRRGQSPPNLREIGDAIMDLDDLAWVVAVELEEVGATMWPAVDPPGLARRCAGCVLE
jgi:hypothetical protein